MQTLADHFSSLDDPRCPSKTRYGLTDILVIAVCAVVAGAQSYEDIALYGRSKHHWLSSFLDLPAGIPSHDTFRRAFMLVDARAFTACFQEWAISQATSLDAGQVVALDGKTVRGSFDRRREQSPLHVVSAWATDQSLALAQRATDEKSGEITVLPEVLDALQLEGVLVTIDAMGCQKKIARRITRGKGDYLLALKANHRKAYWAAEAYFEHSCLGRNASRDDVVQRRRYDAFDDSHGRLVRRRVFSCGDAARLEALSGWPGLKSVWAVENIRSITGRRGVTSQIRYFLSSRPAEDERAAAAIRQHWSIENGLHWVLDVTFGEDECRIRDRTAAENWTLLRKIALNLLQSDSSRSSIAARRKRAGWDDDYLFSLLHGNLMR